MAQQRCNITPNKILEAGQKISELYVEREHYYSTVDKHPIMFPPAPDQTYVDAFTEDDHSYEEVRQYQYEAECDVYRALEALTPNRQMVVLHNFKYNQKQSGCFMDKSLKCDGEQDFVVIVRGYAVVLLEVKCPVVKPSYTDSEIIKNKLLTNIYGLDGKGGSKKQLQRMSRLLAAIARKYRCANDLTVLQFTVFPRMHRIGKSKINKELSKKKRFSDEEYDSILFQEDIESRGLFNKWWERNVEYHVVNSVIDPKIEAALLGLWCVDDKNVLNTDRCSLGYCIKHIDKALKDARITRKVDMPVSGNVKVSPPVFKEFLDIVCLTEAQESIFFDEMSSRFIIGPAGSGKTVLMMGKIIELAKSAEQSNKIVFFTQKFHNYDTIFRKAGIESVFIIYDNLDEPEKIHFSYCDWINHDVVIVQHRMCFQEKGSLLLELMFNQDVHVFIDDLHALLSLEIVPSFENVIRGHGIKRKSELLGKLLSEINKRQFTVSSCLFWAAFDASQVYQLHDGPTQILLDPGAVDDFPSTEHLDDVFDKLHQEMCLNQNSFNYLPSVLRNSYEITNMIESVKEQFANYPSRTEVQHGYIKSLPPTKPGHFIHSPKPKLFFIKLKFDTPQYIISLKHIILDEVHSLLNVGDTLELKDIVIINDTKNRASATLDTVKQVFEISPELNNIKVLTSTQQVQSSEWKAVIYINDNIFINKPFLEDMNKKTRVPMQDAVAVSTFGKFYIKLTRARVYLSVIIGIGATGWLEEKDDLLSYLSRIDASADKEYKNRAENKIRDLFKAEHVLYKVVQ